MHMHSCKALLVKCYCENAVRGRKHLRESDLTEFWISVINLSAYNKWIGRHVKEQEYKQSLGSPWYQVNV